MATAYAWHPGTGVDRPRWVRSVPLLPDEIISSWLVRAALAQGCDPMVLTGEIWPKWRIWTRDVDRFLDDAPLNKLVTPAGIPLSSFRAATLKSVAERVSNGPLPDKAVWPWILALGTRNTKRRGGLQYCPICLDEDPRPYYRIQWRFAWHVGCERHGGFLLDRCPNCDAPLEPHRLSAENGHVALCGTCKADLRRAKVELCQGDAMAFQGVADMVVQSGVGRFVGRELDGDSWFAGVSFFASLLRRANRGGTGALHDFLNRLGATAPSLPLIAGSGVELLRTQERQQLLDALWKLVQADPVTFAKNLKASGLSRQGFVDKGERSPDMLAEAYAMLPDNAVERRKRVGRSPQKLRPRHEVMRMWQRLQRKLEMQRR